MVHVICVYAWIGSAGMDRQKTQGTFNHCRCAILSCDRGIERVAHFVGEI